jgi:putative oxidoreductase
VTTAGGVGPFTRGQLVDTAYAVLRIVSGALFCIHGPQKLFGWFGGHAQPMFSQLWFGAIIELVGGALIALGLFTRWAAFVCCGQMAVAYCQFHWKLDFAGWKFLPQVNGGEDTVLYCFVFLLFAAYGDGRASLGRLVYGAPATRPY